MKQIDEAAQTAPTHLKGRVLGYRAWALSRIPNGEANARDAYAAALDADPSNPFHLTSFLEYEIFVGEKLGLRSALAPTLTRAVRKCRDHIDAGIEVPWSFIAIGRLQLLVERPLDSLAAYAKVIQLCLEEGSTVPSSALDDEITFLCRINRGHAMQEHHQWVHTLLLLGRTILTGERPTELSADRAEFAYPVVILAGGARSDAQATVDGFRGTVLRAVEGFQGTIISGGTRAGVPGLAGEIATAERVKRAGPLQVLGYIPRQLPWDQPVDSRYTSHLPADGQAYGAGHALRYWTDLILAGVKPEEVRLLGIDGGEIASFEYRLALALGAQVGVIRPATREASKLLQDPDWERSPRLIAIPKDVCSLQAFLQPPKPRLTGEQLDAAAEKIHAAYFMENHHVNPDPAMKPWEELDEKFKRSNRMQAAAAISFLERAGFTIAQASGEVEPLVLTETQVGLLAEMEHGRWNVERLRGGWRYGEKRDTEKKLHPDLIGWEELPENVKDWDRRAVRKWPQLLADAGYTVRHPKPTRTPRRKYGAK